MAGIHWPRWGARAASVCVFAVCPAYADLSRIDLDSVRGRDAGVTGAVEIIDSERIRRLNVSDLEDVSNLVSGLQLDTGRAQSDVRLTLRGLQATVNTPNVAVMIDGADISSQAIGFPGAALLIDPRLLDLDRVEVLKGPQTASFGRNAVAGVINYVTRAPTDTFEAELRGDGGNYGRAEAEASMSGPIVADRLGFRVFGAFWNDFGAYENPVTSQEMGTSQGWATGATVHWTPNARWTVKARLSYADDEIGRDEAALPATDVLAVPSALAADNPALDAAAGVDPRTGLPLFSDPLINTFAGAVPSAGDIFVRRSPDFIKTGGTLPAFSEYPGAERQVLRAHVTAQWDLAFGQVAASLHFMDADHTELFDFDKRGEGFFGKPKDDLSFVQSYLDLDTETRVFSQDIRFQSDWDAPVQATVAAHHFSEDVDQTEQGGALVAQGARCVLPGDCPGFTGRPAFAFVDEFAAAQTPRPLQRDIDHWSVLTGLTFNLSELGLGPTQRGTWRLEAKARFVWEDQDIAGITPTAFGAPRLFFLCGPNQSCDSLTVPARFAPQALMPTAGAPLGYDITHFSRSDSYWTPQATLEWAIDDAHAIYLSASRVVRPGGFSTLGIGAAGLDADRDGRPSEIEWQKEKLTVVELGARAATLGGDLALQGAVFFQKVDDKQLVSTALIGDQFTPVASNAAEATIFGAELSADWRPAERWRFHVSYTFLDAEYDRTRIPTSDLTESAALGCEAIAPLSTVDGAGAPVVVPQCVVDLNGRRLEGAPRHALVGHAGYQAPLVRNIRWFAEATVRYQSQRPVTADNLVMLDSYAETDVRLGLQGRRWEFLLYADNLFDNDAVKSAYTGVDFAGPSVYRTGSGAGESIATPRLTRGTFVTLPDSFTYGFRATVRF